MTKSVDKGVSDEFGGPLTVTREQSYSEKMFAALERRRKSTGIAITEQVRRALSRDLLSEAQNAPICLDVDPPQLQALQALSQQFGYHDAAQLVENLAKAALKQHPREVFAFISPELAGRPAGLSDAMAYADAKMREMEERKRKGTWPPNGNDKPKQGEKKDAA